VFSAREGIAWARRKGLRSLRWFAAGKNTLSLLAEVTPDLGGGGSLLASKVWLFLASAEGPGHYARLRRGRPSDAAHADTASRPANGPAGLAAAVVLARRIRVRSRAEVRRWGRACRRDRRAAGRSRQDPRSRAGPLRSACRGIPSPQLLGERVPHCEGRRARTREELCCPAKLRSRTMGEWSPPPSRRLAPMRGTFRPVCHPGCIRRRASSCPLYT
jgi:hypothetical protein